jgi:hypothetical protein
LLDDLHVTQAFHIQPRHRPVAEEISHLLGVF